MKMVPSKFFSGSTWCCILAGAKSCMSCVTEWSRHAIVCCVVFVSAAEQFRAALVVRATTLALSTQWTARLTAATSQSPAVGTSTWHGSLGRFGFYPNNWFG
jgi:hypothetical protein